MTYPVTTGGLIQPFPDGAFGPRDSIATTSDKLGLGELAENQITLWAQSGQMLICETAVDYNEPIGLFLNYFASYVIQIPRHLNHSVTPAGRRYLEVFVASSTASVELRVYPHAGGTILATGAPATVDGVAGYFVSIPLPQGDDFDVETTLFGFILAVYDSLEVGTFNVTSVHGILKRVSGALPEGDESCRPDEWALVHPDQVGGDEAWDVNTARDFVKVNALLYASNIRPVVTKGLCHPIQISNGETTALPTADDYKITLSDDTSGGAAYPSLYHEWLYFPRQGVNQVRVVLNMSRAASVDDRTVVVHFDGHPGEILTVDQTTFTPQYVAATGWRGIASSVTLDVPTTGAPLRLRVTLVTQASRPEVYLHHVTLLEGISPVAMES